MNRKQIEDEMKRVTEEGRLLQEKLVIVEALRECKRKGHHLEFLESDIDFNGGSRVSYQCKRCNAVISIKDNGDENDGGSWWWDSGPFKDMTVEDVYEEPEIEWDYDELVDTTAIDELNANAQQQVKEFKESRERLNQEETNTGAYRVDTSSMFKTRDNNVEY